MMYSPSARSSVRLLLMGLIAENKKPSDTNEIIRDEGNGAEASGGDTTKKPRTIFSHVTRQTSAPKGFDEKQKIRDKDNLSN